MKGLLLIALVVGAFCALTSGAEASTWTRARHLEHGMNRAQVERVMGKPTDVNRYTLDNSIGQYLVMEFGNPHKTWTTLLRLERGRLAEVLASEPYFVSDEYDRQLNYYCGPFATTSPCRWKYWR